MESTESEKRRIDQVRKNIHDSQPILADLRQAGFELNSIADLYNLSYNYRNAIPLLISWLTKVDNPDVKEVLVRALSVKWAKGYEVSRLLIREFENASTDSSLRWAVGNALSIVSVGEVVEDLIRIVKNTEFGSSREMVVIALGKHKTIASEKALLEVINDPELLGHAIIALGQIKSKDAIPLLINHLSDPKPWIRKEAQRALEKIDKYYQGN